MPQQDVRRLVPEHGREPVRIALNHFVEEALVEHDHRLAPAWHKLGRLLYRYGENFYNFEGLRHYKDKFEPEWRPRYLAAPSGMALPRVLLDVTALISGGIGRTVGGASRRAP